VRLGGRARFGVSLVYRAGGGLGELRFSNLTEGEARETLEGLGRPDDLVPSRENPESQERDTAEQARELANRLRAELGLSPLQPAEPRPRARFGVFDLEIDLIRRALKREAPTLSVRRGRGTACGWVEVWGSGPFHEFTEGERRALEALGLDGGGNCAVISPEDTKRYAERAARLLGTPLPPALREEYERRDRRRLEMEREAEERRRAQEGCGHEWELRPWLVFPNPERMRVVECRRCGKTLTVERERLGDYLGTARRDPGSTGPPDLQHAAKGREAEGLAGLAGMFGLGPEEAAGAIGELAEAIRAEDSPAGTLRRLASRMAAGERRALLLGVLLAEAAGLNLRERRGEEGEGYA
jgi:hypothetical protein